MAKLFLSYCRDDRKKAAALVEALEGLGHSLWWDREVQAGSRFSQDIERELAGADVVLVLWSKESVNSTWVQDEAAEGRDTGRLVPALIDNIKPPLGFRQFQAVDLSGWNGRADEPAIDDLHNSILARSGTGEVRTATHRQAVSQPSARRFLVVALMLMGIALAGLLAWIAFRPRAEVDRALRVQLTEFTAISPDVPRSVPQTLREELLAALATDAMILATDREEKADGMTVGYAVKASVRKLEKSLRFTIHLSNRQTGNNIWSISLERPTSISDIAPRQVAIAASQVLRCGIGGAATYSRPMPDPTLSLYFKYCEIFADVDGQAPNHERAMDLARRLTREAPDFSRSWSGFAQQAAIAVQGDKLLNSDAIRKEARSAAQRALVLDKNNSEAYQALARLQPPTALLERERLHIKSVSVRPSDCGCEYVDYGVFLSRVGRNSESVDAIKRARDMLPLKADINAIWAESLYIDRRSDEAEPIMRELFELWPDYGYLREIVVRSAFWTERYDAALQHLSDPPLPVSGEEREALRAALVALKAGDAAMTGRVRTVLRSLAEKPAANRAILIPALVATGGEEEALAMVGQWADKGSGLAFFLLFEPPFARVRQSSEFAQIVQRHGLVDYWRQSKHLPDFCKEATAPALCSTL